MTCALCKNSGTLPFPVWVLTLHRYAHLCPACFHKMEEKYRGLLTPGEKKRPD